MKIKKIKIKVKNDRENQYVLNKYVELNGSLIWYMSLDSSYGYLVSSSIDYHSVLSVWKGFRYIAINEVGNLILFDTDVYWNERDEPEITFEEFKKLCEEKQ